MLQLYIFCPISTPERPMQCYKQIPFTFSVHIYLSSLKRPFSIEKVPFHHLRVRCRINSLGEKNAQSFCKCLYFQLEPFNNKSAEETAELTCVSKISVIFPANCKNEIYAISMDLVIANESHDAIPSGLKDISSAASTSAHSSQIYVNVLSFT